MNKKVGYTYQYLSRTETIFFSANHLPPHQAFPFGEGAERSEADEGRGAVG